MLELALEVLKNAPCDTLVQLRATNEFLKKFEDKILKISGKTLKSSKIGALEIFQLYDIASMVSYLPDTSCVPELIILSTSDYTHFTYIYMVQVTLFILKKNPYSTCLRHTSCLHKSITSMFTYYLQLTLIIQNLLIHVLTAILLS